MTSDERIAAMTLATVYPCYVTKVTRKGRTPDELDQVLCWLLQCERSFLQQAIDQRLTLSEVFATVTLHPDASLITGSICGHRIETIENPLSQQVRRMDKVVDELAKGRTLQRIMRIA